MKLPEPRYILWSTFWICTWPHCLQPEQLWEQLGCQDRLLSRAKPARQMSPLAAPHPSACVEGGAGNYEPVG